MTLRLPDKWVWDFWLVRDGRDYHAFYLQAPRSLGDPELRHLNASIGHATSKDLRHWRILPDAFRRNRRVDHRNAVDRGQYQPYSDQRAG